MFMISAFLEAPEFGIELHETNESGAYNDRIVTRSILLEVPGRIRACCYPYQLVKIL